MTRRPRKRYEDAPTPIKQGPQIVPDGEAYAVAQLTATVWKIVAYQAVDMGWTYLTPMRDLKKHATTVTLKGDRNPWAYVLVAKLAAPKDAEPKKKQIWPTKW